MPEAAGVFGSGSTAEQLFVWQVVAQVIAALMAPAFGELGTIVNSTFQNVKLSPADAATAANRSFLDGSSALAEAQSSGIDEARFNILKALAGNAPAPDELALMLRKGIIPKDGAGPAAVSFRQGIAEGNLLDKWTDAVEQNALVVPSPADIVDAMLKGQLSAADAQRLFLLVGGDPQYLQLLVNIAGNPPSPSELLDLANRQLIPWEGTGPDVTSFQQGIYEGRLKDKWWSIYRREGEYRPPPETVRAMLEANGITVDQATAYWTSYGMTADTIAQYIQTANNTKNQAAQGLTEASVLQMYYNQFISADDATTYLGLMGIDAGNAQLLEAYVDMQRSVDAVTKVVSRLQTLYTARKIDTATAQGALTALQVPGAAIDGLIASWDIAASVNVKTLTETQIIDAWDKGVLTLDQASGELQAIGYTPFDAWVLLATKDAANAGTAPEALIAAPLGAVIPGVT